MSATRGGARTSAQHALDGLRHAIVAGELRPGQRVLQEELAISLGVSIAPVREALRMLQQEGQLTYHPNRGYFVTALRMGDLREIYELRQMLEERAARAALPNLVGEEFARIVAAADECRTAAGRGDVATELEANRRFHFAILAASDMVHTMRLISLLWDSTEPYRALYYNSPAERQAADEAHQRIIATIKRKDADSLVAELDAHRARALHVLNGILSRY